MNVFFLYLFLFIYLLQTLDTQESPTGSKYQYTDKLNYWEQLDDKAGQGSEWRQERDIIPYSDAIGGVTAELTIWKRRGRVSGLARSGQTRSK